MTGQETYLFTVLDRVAGANAILTCPNVETAKRLFIDTIKDKGKDQYGNEMLNQFQKNPADYVLIKVAKMDIFTGEITPDYEELLEAYDVINGKTQKEVL